MVKDFDHFVDRPTFNFKDSPYVKNMLINLKGTEWKDVRHLMTPAFSSGKLKAMQSLICTVGEQMTDYLNKDIAAKGNSTNTFFFIFNSKFVLYNLSKHIKCLPL